VPLLELRPRDRARLRRAGGLEDGSLAPARWASYRKLGRELAHLERRLDKRLQVEERKRWAKLGAEGKARSQAKRGG
jgi:ribosome biogenesis GTPase / thiamine phosphate phosphatase